MRRRQSNNNNNNNSNSNPKRRCCCCSSSPSPSMMMLLILFMTILVVLFPGSSSSSVMGFIVPTKFSSSRTTVASTVSTTTTIPSIAIAIANSAPKTTRTSLKKSTMIFSSSIDNDSDNTNNAAGATATDETNTADTASSTGISKKRKPTGFSFWYKIPKKAYRLYTGYAKQLWKDTDTSARSKIANDKVAQTVRDMQHVLSNEYATNIDDQQADDEDTISSSSSSSSSSDGSKKSEEAKERLLKACDDMLIILDENNNDKSESTAVVAVATEDPDADTAKQLAAVPTKKKVAKKQRSVLFGAVMGALVAGWVFSGNYIFTGLFCLITILGQLEYYRMIMNTGVFPARRISVVGATSMFVTVRIYIYNKLVLLLLLID